MIDCLLRFPTEEARAKVLLASDGSISPRMPDGSSAVYVTVLLHNPAFDEHDPETDQTIRGSTPSEGFWLGVAYQTAPEVRHPATIIEMRRPDKPTYWRDCIMWSALTEFPPVIAVSPSFAGSGYVFD
jgi:hypothetical protein